MDWSGYYKRVEAPNRMMVGAFIEYVRDREAALDLGAGNLRDSKFLQRRGFKRIVAVDSAPECTRYTVPGIELHIMPIEQYVPQSRAFSFVYSCNTLFLLKPSQVYRIFEHAWRALKHEGIFVCNLMGPDADWVKRGEAWGWNERGVDEISRPFEVLKVRRSQSREPGVSGKAEQWDNWELVLRKV